MNVAFRVDASPRIGTGHFMRCLCLADALHRRGAAVRFVTRQLPGHLARMLLDRTYDVAALEGTDDAGETARALTADACDWLVVDHYALDARWESMLRAHAKQILAIDDLADRPHDCDVLLDQNLYADMERRYAGRVPESCRMLLGPQYALLRDEFIEAREKTSPRAGRVKRVLVSFGGADARNHTSLAIQALVDSGVKLSIVDVAVGEDHLERRDIEAACARHGFRCHVQTSRMAELMAAADLAIGAGGTTTWERCCVGLPALVLSLARNQDAVIAAAALQGLVYTPGANAPTAADLALHVRALADNPQLLQMISRHAMQAVDGRGADRVARVLGAGAICVREARHQDAEVLFEWRNDESVRRASRRPDPIAWPDHEAWMQAVLSDANRLLLIGECDGAPVGVVRFDVTGQQAEVSIYRVPGSAGRGLGSSLLLAAERWLHARRPDVSCVTAEVLGDNERSHHLFLSSGYHRGSASYRKSLHVS